MNLLHLDLFSGIGGFALAAGMNQVQTVAFVEKDKYAQKVLRKNFAGVPIYDDICTFDGKPFRGVWLLTGGFPCQPFSLAGKRRGASDDRALWPQMLRVINEAKPRWVLGENVPGIISMELDNVLADLERLNYSAWSLTVPACAVDARHRRDRVWIVAHAASGQDDGRKCRDVAEAEGCRESLNAATDSRGETLADTDRLNGRARTGRENGAQARNSGEDVPDANGAGREEQRRTVANGEEHEAAQYGNRWQPEPAICRVAHGIPNRVDRLRGLGNAIVPQVARELIHNMKLLELSCVVAVLAMLAAQYAGAVTRCYQNLRWRVTYCAMVENARLAQALDESNRIPDFDLQLREDNFERILRW